MKPVWLVPLYRQARQFGDFLPRLLATGLPVLVIDDGNDPPCAFPSVSVLRHGRNLGKGASVVDGFGWALANGFTHGIQIDADGQHNVEDALGLLKTAEGHPGALVSGFPQYDAAAPAARLRGRAVTRLFVRLETGLRHEDGLCGCRVYPLGRAADVGRELVSRRMGFDVEFLVRWAWRGWPVLSGPVRVSYAQGGVSNFRYFRDNVAFFGLHTRLCLARLAKG